jgi:hypothetical protein
MRNYLAANELASLIGCEPNSFSCMCRWLKKGDWPFERNIRGFPQVSREYHDARMRGVDPRVGANDNFAEPDFSRFA